MRTPGRTGYDEHEGNCQGLTPRKAMKCILCFAVMKTLKVLEKPRTVRRKGAGPLSCTPVIPRLLNGRPQH